MFTLQGTLQDGTPARLWWTDDGLFNGDQAALDAVSALIADGDEVAATAEGPFLVAGGGDFATAVATAGAVFARVQVALTDEPDGFPEYDGGVVGADMPDDGGPLQEALRFDPAEHPRGRLGRWIEVLSDHPVSPPTGDTLDTVGHALAAINQAHEPPAEVLARPLTIRVAALEDSDANYGVNAKVKHGRVVDYDPLGLTASPGASRVSIVHEIGHFLDHVHFGAKIKHEPTLPDLVDGDYFGSKARQSAKMKKLIAVIEGSEAVAKIGRSMEDDRPRHVEIDGQIVEIATSRYWTYGYYLLKPYELFARAYSQWVALKSGDADMRAEIKRYRQTANPYPQYWMDKDFAPIAAEMDKLFATVKTR